MNPTTICYVIRQLGKGGAEKQLFYLVRGLDRSRFQPVVLSLTPGGYWKRRFNDLKIDIFELTEGRLRLFNRLIQLVKLFNRIRPDIVHTFMFTANSYGRLAALLAGVRVVIGSERSIAERGNDKTKWGIWLDKALLRFSDAVICNTNRARFNLIDNYRFPAEKLMTIPNGFDWTEFRSHSIPGGDEGKKSSEKVVGMVATLSKVKNHRLFLDVARIVLDRYSGDALYFMVVGDGPLRGELQAYAQKIGLDSKMRFMGPRDDIPLVMGKMDIYIHTSRFEGLSNAIMEAMGCGLPVVATDVGGNRELVNDGKTGFLCPSMDAYAIAEKVLLLLRDDDLAHKMGARGKQKIWSCFSVERMIEETVATYDKFLQRKFRENQK
ncbi:MAG: glycosyltransferase [Deltaproteobacteria bacterium]|nr:glycosyltransferase [Deltaproteobacteria bacterium]